MTLVWTLFAPSHWLLTITNGWRTRNLLTREWGIEQDAQNLKYQCWIYQAPSSGRFLLLLKGIIDSSGFRFYYTKQLRKYDAGLLLVGAGTDQALMIPPRVKNWEINGFCSSNCTRQVCCLTLSPDCKRLSRFVFMSWLSNLKGDK